MSEIIKGSDLSRVLREEMKTEIDALKAEGSRLPCLAVVLVGEDPASISYVKGKKKACAAVGLDSRMYHLPSTASQSQLDEILDACSRDETVDGVLMQLPLPEGLNEYEATLHIDPRKDVDGLHPMNVGRLYLNNPGFVPCTPLGIMEILKRMHCDPAGKRAVVVGRSKLVGAPVARLLQNGDATVTICHSHTRSLASITRQADILIAAVGRPKFITVDMVKEGACVIDVGVNKLENGHLCGDVDFEAVKETASAITPVPGGVGPLTITMLMKNTLKAYQELRDGEQGIRAE